MAEENNKNDVMTVLKTPIMLLVLVIILVGYLAATQLVPKIQEFVSNHSTYQTQIQSLADKKRTLDELKAKAEQNSNKGPEIAASGKALFRPLESGMDTETIIASEFNEVLSLMTSNMIKTRSVKYTEPEDDNFIKADKNKYAVSKLDMEMIASYTNFKNFMKDLYKHDHYLDIAKVEIVPYQKNKSILLINLQLKLYAEKV